MLLCEGGGRRGVGVARTACFVVGVAVLQVQAHMYLTGEETAALLHLITCTFPPFSSAGVKFVEVALCVLLACPFLLR